jgi:activator of 2-hydroxyglutaryl-CoA dehydratase/predicted nucleotide-binding protein (sugar kinase/HSP70/actin superfamily)
VVNPVRTPQDQRSDGAPRAAAGPVSRGLLFAGVDLGKVTTCVALVERTPSGRLEVVATHAERHLGEPLAPFLRWYATLDHGRLAGLAATGVYGDRLGEPALGGLPEEIAQEAAAAWLYPEGPLNVVRVGGGGYSVLTRDARGLVDYEANERCSAGTGETVEGLCTRLGRSLDEAVAAAEASPDGVTVTSRCAVFAKSELTHFANQGEPHGRIFKGLFAGVARNVHSLYDKSKVDGPVVLVGHGALIAPVAGGIARLSDAPVTVAPEAGAFEALGAAAFAAATAPVTLPADPAALVRPVRSRIPRLEPAAAGPGCVRRLEATGPAPAPGEAAARPAVLGLDLGSTGSKAALLDLASGATLASVYRRTEGNPVEAAQALVAEVGERVPAPVVAVGLTGSGRDAAAAVFRAAFPELGGRLTVENEIVAHAVAAARLDPDDGRSLSIVEIGGQDAKFINVEGGRVVDADMNRVCSAGTGSFLEEQAQAHGVDDIAQFGRLAARSDGPPDLGQTCTVFVADVAAEALNDGYSREDIFAGLQHSVVRNYRSRVMGQRRLLDRVFFQGKPATDPSLARTVAAVLEREVYVPPDPGAMGAVGIALLAAGALNGGAPAPIDLRRLLEAAVAGRREFQCRDRDCGNACHLELAEIDVLGERRKVVSGGQCPKYDEVSPAAEKLPREAPNPYRERAELLDRLLAEETDRALPTGLALGLPYAHYLIDVLPFFHTLLRRMGHDVRVLRPGPDTLADGDRRCAALGACAPVKLLHGLAVSGVDVFVAPLFVHLPVPNAGDVTYTCPMAQGAPDMVARALAAEGSPVRVLRPVLFEKEGEDFGGAPARRALRHAVDALGEAAGSGPAEAAAFTRAYDAALRAQRRFEAGLRDIGTRALAWAREHDYPVVLVVGESHVIHDDVLDAGIHELVAANGALPLPVDCFPVPAGLPGVRRVHWASAGQTLRATAAGAMRGDVYPLLLGAYGCGPNSMVEHLFADLVDDRPHAVLESDGHGGRAGYVTRVQAFLHSVRAWRAAHRRDGTTPRDGGGAPAALPEARLQRFDRPLPHSLDGGYDRFYFGHVGGGLGEHLAAAMRGAGYDASFVGAPDALALRAAGAACSGKECLPYQLIWGSFARFLEREAGRLEGRRALFLSAGNGFQACRANLFPYTEQMSLERLGLGDRIEVADFSVVTSNVRMMPVVWIALVAVDLLNMLRFYHLATERVRGDSDALFAEYSARLVALLEQPRPDRGTAGNVAGALAFCAEVEDLLREAARSYRRGTTDPAARELRDVYLCGDLYLRVDEWGNDDLQRKLADRGLRPIFEPYGAFFELLQLRQIQDGVRLRKRPEKELTLLTMRYVIGRLMKAVRADHPWAFWNDVRDVDREARRVVAPYPFGETIPAVGGALLTWRTQPVDGVVSVAPRGCGPALIAEAQLRREAGLPALFIYNDGDPIDEARLAGFAWRLHSRPARRGGAGHTSGVAAGVRSTAAPGRARPGSPLVPGGVVRP